jgi:peptidoglycan/xylan/chitin deacetylase (PgdA/CDA1 family)
MTKELVFLMYHELETADRQLCDDSPGYRRYVVSASEFWEHLVRLQTDGLRALNVSEALKSLSTSARYEQPGVCLTFDDGCASDLHVAAPLLSENNCNATFYVTVNHLGKRGYLTRSELRELSDLGFEIGSHSMTHRHLNDLSRDEIQIELNESKTKLEEIIGQAVRHFSCPGGRVNAVVTEAALRAGYESVATSQFGSNTNISDRFALNRVAIKQGLSTRTFSRICSGRGQLLRRYEESLLATSKRLLGNERYDRLRTTILTTVHRTKPSSEG